MRTSRRFLGEQTTDRDVVDARKNVDTRRESDRRRMVIGLRRIDARIGLAEHGGGIVRKQTRLVERVAGSEVAGSVELRQSLTINAVRLGRVVNARVERGRQIIGLVALVVNVEYFRAGDDVLIDIRLITQNNGQVFIILTVVRIRLRKVEAGAVLLQFWHRQRRCQHISLAAIVDNVRGKM